LATGFRGVFVSCFHSLRRWYTPGKWR
jgi:hypothetical protein